MSLSQVLLRDRCTAAPQNDDEVYGVTGDYGGRPGLFSHVSSATTTATKDFEKRSCSTSSPDLGLSPCRRGSALIVSANSERGGRQ